jgi:L-fuculose-phosphate aldolase
MTDFIPEPVARREMLEVGRRMYQKGFVIATDGNLSARLGRGRFLVTRSGVCKGDMTDRDLVVCDENGKTIRGGRVSSEVLLHLTTYQLRPDVNAAIHAHPPIAVAFTLADMSLSENLLPEVIISLGSIPTSCFAAPSSAEGADVIREVIVNHDAIILDRHGSLTIGKTLWEAYHKLEQIEFAAKVTRAAKSMGDVKQLNKEEMVKVQQAALRYKGGEQRCPSCGGPLHAFKKSEKVKRLDKSIDADLERLAPLVRRIIEEGRM